MLFNTHSRSLRSAAVALVLLGIFSHSLLAQSSRSPPAKARLSAALVKQSGKGLCGPACIEMILRYWNVTKFDQHDIATAILHRYPNLERVKRSGILESWKIDWSKYSGTGTKTMCEFLKVFAATENPKLRALPSDPREATKQRQKSFDMVKQYAADGVPVVVHQYWTGPGTRGQYRVVRGYDDKRRVVLLNDPRTGAMQQSYSEFLTLWDVDEPWLHCNAIVFNTDKRKLRLSSLEP